MRKNILFFLVFLLVLPLFGDISQEFDFLYNASFSFKDKVPYIRAHIKSYDAGTEISGIESFECGSRNVPASSFTFSVSEFAPAVVKYRIAFQELSSSELKKHAEKTKDWQEKSGIPAEVFVNGAIFSINESTIDNREYFVASKELFDKAEAEKLLGRFREQFPQNNISLIPLTESSSKSVINVKTNAGVVHKCPNLLLIHPRSGFAAEKDTYSEKSSYYLVPSAKDKAELAVEASVEELLYRILPGEMFLSAPLETLKAQAVAARTDIFMQLGKRHTAEPWHICSEVHCQKILWNQKMEPKFIQAVKETEGEVIVFNGSHIARAPYCSSAGGRTEDIRNVWFTAEKPYLSGVWDGDEPLDLDLSKESGLKKFLATDYGEDNIKMNKRHRWKVSFSQEKIDGMLNAYKPIGNLQEIRALSRGVSGRIYKAEFVGNKSSFIIYGELNIRRLLNNLYSSSFIASKTGNEWILEGMGWGHGVGMSQTGAISLGRKGRDFRFILKRYYPGTDILKIY